MKSKLKPLLEWIVLITLGVGAGLGLAWLPLERPVKDMGLLVIGSALLIWTVYVAIIAYQTMWFDINDWDDDENLAWLEVKS
jgi:hypothetical protein